MKGRRKAKYRHRFTINVIQPNFFLENKNEIGNNLKKVAKSECFTRAKAFVALDAKNVGLPPCLSGKYYEGYLCFGSWRVLTRFYSMKIPNYEEWSNDGFHFTRHVATREKTTGKWNCFAHPVYDNFLSQRFLLKCTSMDSCADGISGPTVQSLSFSLWLIVNFTLK